MDYSHNGWLIVASLLIALMAAFSGLSLTRGASVLEPARRQRVVALAAVVLGGGIWAMHFVAMLGLQLPILFFYDALYTLISALIAILLVGAALLVLHFLPRTRLRMAVAGSVMGLGILGMHYMGMAGMELCRPVYSLWGVALAIAGAMALSILAVIIAYGSRTRGNILLGTLVFGSCVVLVHFTAMWGTAFVAEPAPHAVGPAISNEALAMGVTIAAFLISGSFLLTGVTFLGPTAPTERLDLPEPSVSEPAPDPVLKLPYEAEGRTHFVPPDEVSAVRAEGHYTILYHRAEKLFCPWSISDAATRLSSHGFIRAHRSYLVNPAHVSEFQRLKDTGALFFEGVASLPKVPVSRSRLAEVRAALRS